MAGQRVNGKQRTLADVRRANGTEAREKMLKRIDKARVEADRKALTEAISNPNSKSVKENLLEIKQMADRSGTKKQRKEVARLFNSELNSDKEMLNWMLSESKNSGDLLSFKKELDAYGSKAQKEQWAKLYEQYNPIRQEANFSTRRAVAGVTQFEGDIVPQSQTLTQRAKSIADARAAFELGAQQRTAQSDAAVAKVTQFKGSLEPTVKPANTEAYHNQMQKVYEDLFGATTDAQQRTAQSDAAVAKVQQFKGQLVPQGLSEAERAKSIADARAAFGQGVQQPTKPSGTLQDILEGLRQQREASQATTPAQELARQVAKPSIPERLIPSVEPKGYIEGFSDGLKKGKKVVHNHNTNNFFNTFITEINDNVSSTVQNEFNKFQKSQNTFISNIDKRFQQFQKSQDNFIAGIDGRLGQFTDAQQQTLGKFEDLASRMDGTLGKMEGAANSVGKSAKKISDAAGKIEGAATSIGQSATKISDAANKIEGAATSIGQSASAIGKSATKIGDAATRMEGAVGKLEGMTGQIEQALQAGQKAQSTLSKLKWAGIGAAAALGAIALFKACSGDNKKAPVQGQELGGKPTPTPVPVTPDDSTKVEKDSNIYVFYPDAVPQKQAPKFDINTQIELPGLGKFFPEEIAEGEDIINGNLNGKKVYVAKKGDCIWNLAKDILAESPKLKEDIKKGLKHKTEDAIIQTLTMAICKANGINYYEVKQTKPQIGDEVQIADKYLEELKDKYGDKLFEYIGKAKVKAEAEAKAKEEAEAKAKAEAVIADAKATAEAAKKAAEEMAA